ncbi:ABC transporter permease [Kamptonema cortianum]|nr:ABC transporter permease [Oscillatoria laete-virens]MDK3155372.1 ABC transporter permease [Kamptonema cortianum]MDL5046121.1 ABC transporter permease [Oscillatoria amoena NRMC-F 0135]MDL5052822.1 ABC transporter permease [Oscillatoria laete-virens NRMC-F 0139]
MINSPDTIPASRRITRVTARATMPLKLLLRDLWRYRDVMWNFAARDIKVKYSQTLFGLSWVVLTPIINVGVITFIFGYMVKIQPNNLPYLVFYLMGFIPWTFGIAVLNPCMSIIENNSGLFGKIYFPRLSMAGVYILVALADFLVGFLLIQLALVFYGKWHYLVLVMTPVLLLLIVMLVAGLGLFLAPLNTRYRDIKHGIPLAIQLGYYATPILYPVETVSKLPSQTLARALELWFKINPMSVIVESFRRSALGQWPDIPSFLGCTILCLCTFCGGVYFFLRREQTLLDEA